jgi:hypothetical protein
MEHEMQPAYKYDAFISFSSKDSEWARRLNADLKERRIRTFFAPEVRVGTVWPSELADALRESQHLVIVWSDAVMSDAAQRSDFVYSEVAAFRVAMSQIGPNAEPQPHRSIIQLLLDRQSKALEMHQAITDLQEGDAYRAGITWIDAHVAGWQSIVTRITESLRAATAATVITTAVLCMTIADVRRLIQEGMDIGLGEQWDAMLTKLEIEPQRLIDSYGASRPDWKPFGNNENIDSVLDRLRAALEACAGGEQFRIDYVNDAFWSRRRDEATPEAAKLGTGLSLLVIDPLSLYNNEVRTRFDFLDPCFENPQAAIMLLTPFAQPRRTVHLRDLIKDMASKVYAQFYEPPIDMRSTSANFSVMTGDEVDMKRMMRTILRGRSTAAQRGAVSPFLRVADSWRR